MTVTEVTEQLPSLLDDIEAGQEIEITRGDVIVARLAPARGPLALKGRFTGVAMSAASDEHLFATNVPWDRGMSAAIR